MRQHGFTLIEMVVALALVGLISISLIESLRFGQRAYSAVVRSGAESWDIFASHRLIRSLLESAYPQQVSAGAVAIYGFEGDSDRVKVLAPASLALGGAGLYRYEIAVHETAGTRNLVARWQPETETNSAVLTEGSKSEEILVSDVASVEWTFRGTEAENETVPGDVWQATWHGRPRPPALIRLRIAFPPDDPRQWPDLIIAPRITDDANCAFDIVAQRCRDGS